MRYIFILLLILSFVGIFSANFAPLYVSPYGVILTYLIIGGVAIYGISMLSLRYALLFLSALLIWLCICISSWSVLLTSRLTTCSYQYAGRYVNNTHVDEYYRVMSCDGGLVTSFDPVVSPLPKQLYFLGFLNISLMPTILEQLMDYYFADKSIE